jgi:2-oxoglutarate ferredoxin oxidoreductase subunit alpha
MARFGRNGECPLPIVAAATPADCFHMVFEAARIALKYMTPVIFLSDGFLANGAEPWKIPHVNELPDIKVKFVTDPEGFFPYSRDENLSRPWAIPGTPGLEHRIGGLEKEHISGNISYDPKNHEFMVKQRAQKIKNIENDIPLQVVEGDQQGELLILAWGSTYGAITAAVENMKSKGINISKAHVRYLNPFPKNLGEVLKRFKKVLVPELNLGQLSYILRAEYLVDVISYPKIQGQPFKASEIEAKVKEILGGSNNGR